MKLIGLSYPTSLLELPERMRLPTERISLSPHVSALDLERRLQGLHSQSHTGYDSMSCRCKTKKANTTLGCVNKDTRKIPSAPHSGGESFAEILWMKGCMDGLGMIQERSTGISWSVQKLPERKSCGEGVQHREGKSRQGSRLLQGGGDQFLCLLSLWVWQEVMALHWHKEGSGWTLRNLFFGMPVLVRGLWQSTLAGKLQTLNP